MDAYQVFRLDNTKCLRPQCGIGLFLHNISPRSQQKTTPICRSDNDQKYENDHVWEKEAVNFLIYLPKWLRP